jgi:phage-related protein
LVGYIKTSIIAFKPLVWLDDSRTRVRDFPKVARQRVGFELWEVQRGADPSDWKPMTSAGPGVREIRIHAEGEFRVLYIARFEEAVYVLHAFEKKSRRTPKADVDLANARYRALVNARRMRR